MFNILGEYVSLQNLFILAQDNFYFHIPFQISTFIYPSSRTFVLFMEVHSIVVLCEDGWVILIDDDIALNAFKIIRNMWIRNE